MQTNIGLFLAKRARLHPEKIGLIFEGREISYRDWSERANRAAHGFARLGVKAGDRVGLLMMNSPELLESFFGLAQIGAIVVPLNWRLAAAELAYIINDAGISVLVYGQEFGEAVDSVREDIPAKTFVSLGSKVANGDQAYEAMLTGQASGEPEVDGADNDPLVIMYTSGTTGRPKGAVLTHNNLFYDSCTVSVSMDWRMGDRVLVALPLFHIGALIYTLIDVHIGATTVLKQTFDPTDFLQTIERHRVDAFLSVPAMLNFMVQVPAYKDADLSSVRVALAGTAPVPVPLIQAWGERGIAIQQVYGLTEAAGGVAVLDSEHALPKAGSTGQPMFHTDIRIVDDNGEGVPAGTIGEVLIRGPHVMREYWNNPEATAQTIKNGWLFTGDLGRLDDQGYLYIVERKKDMIISGGENIYPAEIENVLAGMTQVAEAAVIGVPDPQWGEAVCVVARLKESETLDLKEVAEYCTGKLGKYKIPKKLVLTEEPLPRTAAGKVLKRVLREEVV
ncbi:MAG: long-chain fatty acid--CoA ligase [bacterium]